MKKLSAILAVLMLPGILVLSQAWAKTEWEVLQTVKPEHAPIDMLISPEKDRIYVLDDQGWISIYSADGRFKDKIQVGSDVQQIKAGPADDMLFLLSRSAGTIKVVTINLIEKIDTDGSPVKGLPDAPVRIVVFSDFQ